MNDRAMSIDDVRTFLKGRVSKETIREALATGELRGRNYDGNVGWMTTESAVVEWVNGGNVKHEPEEKRDG